MACQYCDIDLEEADQLPFVVPTVTADPIGANLYVYKVLTETDSGEPRTIWANAYENRLLVTIFGVDEDDEYGSDGMTTLEIPAKYCPWCGAPLKGAV